MSKRELAERIWDRVEALRAARHDATGTQRTHRIRK
jgi:hypothetical protein